MQVRLKLFFGPRLNVPNLNRPHISVGSSPVAEVQQRGEVGWAQLNIVLNQHHAVVALLVEQFTASADKLPANAQIFGPSHNRGVRNAT